MATEKAVMLVPYNQEIGGEPKEITAEILQRLHRLESQVLHHASEVPAWRPPTAIDSHGSSARLLAQANGTSVDTESVQPKVSSLANPASLGLFAFAFTTALLQVGQQLPASNTARAFSWTSSPLNLAIKPAQSCTSCTLVPPMIHTSDHCLD